MFRYATYFLYVLVLLDLHKAEKRKCPRFPWYDPLKERGDVCLVNLPRILDHISEMQHPEILKKIEAQQNITKKHLESIESTMRSQLKTLEEKLNQQRKIEYLEPLLEQAQRALFCSLENKKVPSAEKPHPKFQKIGSRYFYIEEHIRHDWFKAASKCREMGGHLALPENKQELSLISEKLESKPYWIDISSLVDKDEYISLVSGKKATFLPWHKGEPKKDLNKHCVRLLDSEYYTVPCGVGGLYVCQAKN